MAVERIAPGSGNIPGKLSKLIVCVGAFIAKQPKMIKGCR